MRAATAVARGVPVGTGCGSFKVCALGLSFCACEVPLGSSSSHSTLTGRENQKSHSGVGLKGAGARSCGLIGRSGPERSWIRQGRP